MTKVSLRRRPPRWHRRHVSGSSRATAKGDGMRMGWRAIRTAIVAVSAVGLLAVNPAATHTRVVEARGPCSGDSHWKLVLVQDGGKITVGYEVVQGIVGDVWRVRIAHNRHIIFRGLQVTHGDDGSFAFRLTTRNTPGPDLIRARARNLSTDEVCRGWAVI